MPDKFTNEELETIRLDLHDRVGYLLTNDEETNQLLNNSGKIAFELMKFAKLGLPPNSRIGDQAVNKVEEAFLLLKEGFYRELNKKNPAPDVPKPEKDRIIKPPGFNNK